jgi:hypothetical protein
MRAAALGLGLLLSAQPEPQKLPEPRTLEGGVRVEARQSTQAKRPGRCVTSVAWPQLRGLASARVEAALNRELEKLWALSDPFADYDCDGEDAAKIYTLLSYEVESLRGGHLTVSQSVYEHEGGIHGNYGSRCFTFSLETGERLELGRALAPAARAALARRVERELLADAGASSLEQGGFLVKRIELREDANLCPTDDGLEVRFDPYEIGPYAMGLLRVTLPYAEARAFFPQAKAFRAVLQD